MDNITIGTNTEVTIELIAEYQKEMFEEQYKTELENMIRLYMKVTGLKPSEITLNYTMDSKNGYCICDFWLSKRENN